MAFIFPLTSSFSPGPVVPMPTLPDVVTKRPIVDAPPGFNLIVAYPESSAFLPSIAAIDPDTPNIFTVALSFVN